MFKSIVAKLSMMVLDLSTRDMFPIVTVAGVAIVTRIGVEY
jgi:hypothetical protein